MKSASLAIRLALPFCVVLCLLLAPARVAAAESIKLEAQLLWGTNDGKSPNPKHKPVEAEVRKKLKELPLKWSNYFEETRKVIELPTGSARRETLSKACTIEVKNSGKSKIEVCLIGKGEQVVRQSQDLPVGETLVVGGNAPNETAWLVIIKRLE